jgi:hypothetical protein
MDAVKGLKSALILVLSVSILLLSWTTYLERSQNRKIEAFAKAMSEVKTESQAKQVIRSFLVSSDNDSLGLSAEADNQNCNWICK